MKFSRYDLFAFSCMDFFSVIIWLCHSVGWSTEVLGSQSSREETGIDWFRYKLSLLVSGELDEQGVERKRKNILQGA